MESKNCLRKFFELIQRETLITKVIYLENNDFIFNIPDINSLFHEMFLKHVSMVFREIPLTG